MENDKQKIKITGVMQLADMTRALERLLADMRNGSIVLHAGDEAVALHPPVLVNVAMKASKNKDAAKIALEISWDRQKGTESCTNKSQ